MDDLENLFSIENEIVEKLKGYASTLDYKKIFFEHLGPELKKIFDSKKDNVQITNFLEASQYEYGFYDKEIDLQKAFSLYKKYADLNDYFCLYKMHVIYLCEYEKFNVKLNRVLEKLYLLKCFAYLPNYVHDLYLKLFDKIDVILEIAEVLDLEDANLEKHTRFFDLLITERKKYNLTENEINLMKGVFFGHFRNDDDSDSRLLVFKTLNSILPTNDLDYTYYHAKNKSIFFQDNLKLDKVISDSEIQNFYKEVKDKKLYEFYSDYGNYVLDKNIKANKEIIDIFTTASEKGYLYSSFRVYQCIVDYYDFYELMDNYEQIENILDNLLKEVVFERLLLGQFVLFMGYCIRYSKFSEKIMSKYLVYIKEINYYVNLTLNQNKMLTEEEEHFYAIKSYIYYIGFKGIEEQNLQKSVELLEKGISVSKETYNKKRLKFHKYMTLKLMNSLKLITDDELMKAKKDLIEYYSKNLKLKYQIIDCYIIGEDYFKGITKKKDEFIALVIYDSAKKLFCKTIIDSHIRDEVKKFLKTHENKFENKIKDEICCICYEKKVDKIFIPCKHNFCSFCANKLEKDSKCPICRSEIIKII